MKIVDQTPYRSETGEIDILGRLQATLKYGLSWHDRIKAQDAVIAILEKQLGTSYTLLRNITLPGTEIVLPMILIGSPGIFLINALHERGVYMARDDEWGTLNGSQLVPARINQLARTLTMARVLQVYLDRQGYKGAFSVEPVLMAADPGLHIESTRPAARVVMSDALERFAASLPQGRAVINPQLASDLVQAITVGKPQRPQASQLAESAPADGEVVERAAFETYTPQSSQSQSGAFTDDPLAFSFNDQPGAEQPGDSPAEAASAAQAPAASSAPARPARARTAAGAAGSRRRGGVSFSRNQWIVLIVLGVSWLCLMVCFMGYAIYSLNG